MSPLSWPSPAHEQAFRSFLLAAQALLDHLDRQLLRDAEMPLAYFQILACLAQAPYRTLRMSDLADHLHASRSRLSHAIARLEARGWVYRCACVTDRRGTYAVLTDPGLTAFEAAAPRLIARVHRHLFDPLSPAQIEQLRTISDLIASHLAGTSQDAAGYEC